jgi:hypothetical protein
MRRRTAKARQAEQGQAQAPDPRLAAFARLLARDLARRHFRETMDRDSGKDYPAKDGEPSGDLP